ncbi:single-stranded DNA-binding protein [Noviherbaspirillum sp. Root189]|uniref:single-stranded DNA-binding protein n=1 Tax=Noviherbaspirillum sp. Root189 TaxID=1736487 RepID=UPI00070E9EB6|nr:single-stranded DNA-binding protein [Noviherbaspirillum sp. Root189]KRB70482.1 single-stranded DNA-binding protein [Noviherbaspirillum sp. Root189]
MATLNKVTLIGYLGRDPERRVTAHGDAVTQMTVATNESWKDKSSGERKQTTEWHRVVLYRKLAEIAGEYLKKGSLVYVEGRLQTRKWIGKDDVERTAVEIIADDLRMLGARPHDDEHEGEASHPPQDTAEQRESTATEQAKSSRYDFIDDAIPF